MPKILAGQLGAAGILAQQQDLEPFAHLSRENQSLQRALLARRSEVEGEVRRQGREHAQEIVALRRESGDVEARGRGRVGARAEVDPRRDVLEPGEREWVVP